jgi:hypothetical protein
MFFTSLSLTVPEAFRQYTPIKAGGSQAVRVLPAPSTVRSRIVTPVVLSTTTHYALE